MSDAPPPKTPAAPLPPLHPRAGLGRYANRLDLILGAAALLIVALIPEVREALGVKNGYRGTVPNIVLFLGIYTVLALGLNVVVGFTGLLDLGYVTFLVTGAVFTSFMLSLTRTETGIDWPMANPEFAGGEPVMAWNGAILLILLGAGVLCALVGLLRGIPTLRVRGDYYAIVTLGFAEIVYEVALWDDSNLLNVSRITNGAFGVNLSDSHRPTLFGAKLYYDTWQLYFLIIAVVVGAFLMTHHLNRSRIGRALAAIRLDETAAQACGVNVAKHKMIAFAVSGFIGGVGGGLYAIWNGTVAVKGLDVWQSVLILCGVVLGGMGSIRGTAVGIAGLMCLGEVLREDIGGVSVPPEARFLIYGLLLIIVMRFRPQGILPAVRRGTPVTAAEHEVLTRQASTLYTLGRPQDANRETDR